MRAAPMRSASRDAPLLTWLSFFRILDLVVMALALPIFLAAGFPLGGWAVGAAAWTLQRGVQLLTTRKARTADDPRTVVGVLAGSMIGRGWFVALSIFAIGLADNHAGLGAAVLVIVLFTVYFTVGMIVRPFDVAPPASSQATAGAQRTGSDGSAPGSAR
jgi:hypothetical protein